MTRRRAYPRRRHGRCIAREKESVRGHLASAGLAPPFPSQFPNHRLSQAAAPSSEHRRPRDGSGCPLRSTVPTGRDCTTVVSAAPNAREHEDLATAGSTSCSICGVNARGGRSRTRVRHIRTCVRRRRTSGRRRRSGVGDGPACEWSHSYCRRARTRRRSPYPHVRRRHSHLRRSCYEVRMAEYAPASVAFAMRAAAAASAFAAAAGANTTNASANTTNANANTTDASANATDASAYAAVRSA